MAKQDTGIVNIGLLTKEQLPEDTVMLIVKASDGNEIAGVAKTLSEAKSIFRALQYAIEAYESSIGNPFSAARSLDLIARIKDE